MPTYERRYFLGLLNKDTIEKEERIEELKNSTKTTNSKGSRTTKINGQNLKNRIKSGDLPIS